MKHLLIDCENLANDFPKIDFIEDQHIWLFLYENSTFPLPLTIVEKIFHHSPHISIIRFPKFQGGNLFSFLAFQLGKISSTDPNPSFELITKRSLLIKQESLLNTLPIEIRYQGIKISVPLPPPAKEENPQLDIVVNQDFFIQVYKLVAYDLFYDKSFRPTLLHNLESRICKYYLRQFEGSYPKEDEEKIVSQVITHFEKKDYLRITEGKYVEYQFLAENIYQQIVNRVLQNRPRFYSQVMRIITAETDFLNLSEEKLELLFEKVCQNNFLIKVDDFIFYVDGNDPSEMQEKMTHKAILNILANPQQKPKTLTELLEKLPTFIKLNIDVEKVIEKLRLEGIISTNDDKIIYNPKYEHELEDKFPKVLLFLCKIIHHTQPRYQETLVNCIYKTFEQKKITLYTVYLVYYRLISEGYIINDSRMIHYYLPAVENWD